MDRLTRSTHDRIVAGVAGGMAEYFGIDAVLMRLIFVLLIAVSGGSLILVYFLLAIIIPSEDVVGYPPREAMRRNVETLSEDLRSAGAEARAALQAERRSSGEAGDWVAAEAQGATARDSETAGDRSDVPPWPSHDAAEHESARSVRRRAPGTRNIPSDRSRQLGAILMAAGVIFLVQEMLNVSLMSLLLPVILVLLGVWLLVQDGNR